MHAALGGGGGDEFSLALGAPRTWPETLSALHAARHDGLPPAQLQLATLEAGLPPGFMSRELGLGADRSLPTHDAGELR